MGRDGERAIHVAIASPALAEFDYDAGCQTLLDERNAGEAWRTLRLLGSAEEQAVIAELNAARDAVERAAFEEETLRADSPRLRVVDQP